MFNFTGKNKRKIDEYATIDNRKKNYSYQRQRQRSLLWTDYKSKRVE